MHVRRFLVCWLPTLALVACLVCDVQGFVVNPLLDQPRLSSGLISIHCRSQLPSRTMVMSAGGGKKKPKRRRKQTVETKNSGPLSAPMNGGSDEKPMIDITDVVDNEVGVGQRDMKLESFFSDDWTGMPMNQDMPKTNVDLPDLADFKSKRGLDNSEEIKPSETLNELPDMSNFQSKLPPLSAGRGRDLSAAERFEEGALVKALKTGTWFCILALVLWEIYINSPLFQQPPSSVIS